MRWDELFADLEGQLEAGLTVQERDLEAEEYRLRLGRLSLRDRVAAIAAGPTHDRSIRIALVDGQSIGFLPRTIGRDWLAGDLTDQADRAQAVLPLAAIAALLPTPAQLATTLEATSEPNGSLTDRLGLPFLLRDLARRRRTVEVITASGTITGTFDRVGRDHVDLAVHPDDEPRHARNVRQVRVIPLALIVLIRVH